MAVRNTEKAGLDYIQDVFERLDDPTLYEELNVPILTKSRRAEPIFFNVVKERFTLTPVWGETLYVVEMRGDKLSLDFEERCEAIKRRIKRQAKRLLKNTTKPLQYWEVDGSWEDMAWSEHEFLDLRGFVLPQDVNWELSRAKVCYGVRYRWDIEPFIFERLGASLDELKDEVRKQILEEFFDPGNLSLMGLVNLRAILLDDLCGIGALQDAYDCYLEIIKSVVLVDGVEELRFPYVKDLKRRKDRIVNNWDLGVKFNPEPARQLLCQLLRRANDHRERDILHDYLDALAYPDWIK